VSLRVCFLLDNPEHHSLALLEMASPEIFSNRSLSDMNHVFVQKFERFVTSDDKNHPVENPEDQSHRASLFL
jgi:hypothetical protein